MPLNVADIFASIKLRFDGDEAIQQAKRATQDIEAGFSRLGVTIATGFGVAAVSAIAGLVRQTLTFEQSLERASRQTGLLIEELAGLDQVARRSGSSLDAMSSMIARLNQQIIAAGQGSKSAQEAFKGLGLDPSVLANMEQGSQRFLTVVEALRTRGSADAFVEAQKLLGNAAIENQQVFSDLARNGLPQLSNAERSALEEARSLNREWTSLTSTLQAFGVSVSGPIIAAINAIINKIKELRDTARDIGKVLPGAGGGVGGGAAGAIGGVGSWLLDQLKSAFNQVWTLPQQIREFINVASGRTPSGLGEHARSPEEQAMFAERTQGVQGLAALNTTQRQYLRDITEKTKQAEMALVAATQEATGNIIASYQTRGQAQIAAVNATLENEIAATKRTLGDEQAIRAETQQAIVNLQRTASAERIQIEVETQQKIAQAATAAASGAAQGLQRQRQQQLADEFAGMDEQQRKQAQWYRDIFGPREGKELPGAAERMLGDIGKMREADTLIKNLQTTMAAFPSTAGKIAPELEGATRSIVALGKSVGMTRDEFTKAFPVPAELASKLGILDELASKTGSAFGEVMTKAQGAAKGIGDALAEAGKDADKKAEPLRKALDGVSGALQKIPSGVESVKSAIADISKAFDDGVKAAERYKQALEGVGGGAKKAEAPLTKESLDDALRIVTGEMQSAVRAADALSGSWGKLQAAIPEMPPTTGMVGKVGMIGSTIQFGGWPAPPAYGTGPYGYYPGLGLGGGGMPAPSAPVSSAGPPPGTYVPPGGSGGVGPNSSAVGWTDISGGPMRPAGIGKSSGYGGTISVSIGDILSGRYRGALVGPYGYDWKAAAAGLFGGDSYIQWLANYLSPGETQKRIEQQLRAEAKEAKMIQEWRDRVLGTGSHAHQTPGGAMPFGGAQLLPGFFGPASLAGYYGGGGSGGAAFGQQIGQAAGYAIVQATGWGRIPAYQMGGMVTQTGPAIVHRGEQILPANAPTSPRPSVTINVQAGSMGDDRQLRRLARTIADLVES